MATLTILRGISGSGKSTWSREQDAVVVSRDSIREAFFPHSTTEDYYKSPIFQDMEDSVTRIQDAAIAGALKSGKDVIVDNTNVEWKFVKALAKIGWAAGATVEVKVFDVSLDTAMARNTFRGMAGGRFVEAPVVKKQHERFQKTKHLQLPEIFTPEPYTGTPGKPKAFMVDIDGTLAHMIDRGPFDWKRVGEDEVDEVVADIVDALRFASGNNYQAAIVMSGRDESCRQQTEAWLDKHNIFYDELFMRPAGDMRPDNIVKAELFDRYVRDNFSVQFVLDDRNQVVEMWRRMGLTCLQVAEGDF